MSRTEENTKEPQKEEKASHEAGGSGAADLTDQLAKEREAKPGAGARQSTAAQVDDPATDETPRPQAVSSRQEPAAPARSGAEGSAGGATPPGAAEGDATREGKPGASEGEVRAGTARAGAAGAAKAGAARAAKQAEEKPQEPSPKQPWLDKLAQKIQERFGEGVVEEAAINRLSQDRPTLVVNKEAWLELARFLKEEPELSFVYLNDIVGIDTGQHMEVVYHLVSIAHRENLTVKVRTDREDASVPSVVSVWPGANWQEREAYDMLGIRFAGHPNLRRIMLPEDWVGHPLRKDYEPYDIEI